MIYGEGIFLTRSIDKKFFQVSVNYITPHVCGHFLSRVNYFVAMLEIVLSLAKIWPLYKLWPWISQSAQGCHRGIRQDLEDHPLNYHYQQKNCVHTQFHAFHEVLFDYVLSLAKDVLPVSAQNIFLHKSHNLDNTNFNLHGQSTSSQICVVDGFGSVHWDSSATAPVSRFWHSTVRVRTPMPHVWLHCGIRNKNVQTLSITWITK